MRTDYFFCQTKIFKGNLDDLPIFRITYLLITGFALLFLIFVGVNLYKNDHNFYIAFYLVLLFVTLYNLCSTQFKDPGIIPKNDLEPIKITGTYLLKIN